MTSFFLLINIRFPQYAWLLNIFYSPLNAYKTTCGIPFRVILQDSVLQVEIKTLIIKTETSINFTNSYGHSIYYPGLLIDFGVLCKIRPLKIYIMNIMYTNDHLLCIASISGIDS